jgi:tetratricopeptide (TPR) repeat protein
MRALITALLACALASPAFAQDDAPQPEQCRPNAAGQVNYQACADAAPVGSPWRSMALINLGTDAYLRSDYAAAVRFYDEARPPAGQQMYSDVTFHAFRAAAYWHVERHEEAQADASMALRMLQGDPTLRMSPRDYMPAHADREAVYALILPVLQTGDAAQFQAALETYNAMPASDWYSYANRAAVLSQLGQHDAALAAGEQALQLAPNEPAVLNNQCAILVELNRAADALPYCERAVAGAPGIAAVRDSMSDVFAALGRCAEAEREIAEARRLDPVSPSYARPIACTAR